MLLHQPFILSRQYRQVSGGAKYDLALHLSRVYLALSHGLLQMCVDVIMIIAANRAVIFMEVGQFKYMIQREEVKGHQLLICARKEFGNDRFAMSCGLLLK